MTSNKSLGKSHTVRQRSLLSWKTFLWTAYHSTKIRLWPKIQFTLVCLLHGCFIQNRLLKTIWLCSCRWFYLYKVLKGHALSAVTKRWHEILLSRTTFFPTVSGIHYFLHPCKVEQENVKLWHHFLSALFLSQNSTSLRVKYCWWCWWRRWVEGLWEERGHITRP